MTPCGRSTKTFSFLLLAAALAAGAPGSDLAAQPPGDGASPLALAAAADYRQEARYPPHARAIEAGRPDPVRARHAPTRHALGGPGGEPPRLEVWAAAVSFQAPEPVDLFASLQGPGRRAAAITGEVQDSAGRTVGEVTYRDDGLAPDERAGDGVYSARFELPEGEAPEPAEAYLVQVHATLEDGDFRKVATGFLYSSPWARLTGEIRDRVVDGDLVISAQVQVERAGRFHVEGTVHTLGGEPVGWAQAAAELEPGTHWLDLSFYGLMFHDRRVSGPVRLGTVALTTAGRMPNALAEPLLNAHVTRPLRLERLNPRPFGRADLLEAADRLERGAGRQR
ncbi:MAG TPA: choice-of-anchor X domain-containing protein [Thermoanaerobaculia bacterium]|nr:choice-of-anchor X domain-containing protein [Thermoanaerobaculia bacterium]